VLSGSASELERELPFWVFVDALDDYLQGLDPRRLAALDEADRAQLGHLFPSFDDHAAGVGPGLQDERFRTHRAVRQLFELLAVPKPLVLVLDDLHWADAATIELLGSLLRSPPAAAVLIAIAVRPRQLPARLSGTLERAIRTGAMSRVELGALSAPEAQQLIGEAVKGRAARRCTPRAAAIRSTSSSSRVRRCVPAPAAAAPEACRSPASRCPGAWRRR
jgi:predicted ATPase